MIFPAQNDVRCLKTSPQQFQNLGHRLSLRYLHRRIAIPPCPVSDELQPVFASVRHLIGHEFRRGIAYHLAAAFATEGHWPVPHTQLATGEPYHAPANTDAGGIARH